MLSPVCVTNWFVVSVSVLSLKVLKDCHAGLSLSTRKLQLGGCFGLEP